MVISGTFCHKVGYFPNIFIYMTLTDKKSDWVDEARKQLYLKQVEEFGFFGCKLLDPEEFLALVEGAEVAFKSGQSPKEFVTEFTSFFSTNGLYSSTLKRIRYDL